MITIGTPQHNNPPNESWAHKHPWRLAIGSIALIAVGAVGYNNLASDSTDIVARDPISEPANTPPQIPKEAELTTTGSAPNEAPTTTADSTENLLEPYGPRPPFSNQTNEKIVKDLFWNLSAAVNTDDAEEADAFLDMYMPAITDEPNPEREELDNLATSYREMRETNPAAKLTFSLDNIVSEDYTADGARLVTVIRTQTIGSEATSSKGVQQKVLLRLRDYAAGADEDGKTIALTGLVELIDLTN